MSAIVGGFEREAPGSFITDGFEIGDEVEYTGDTTAGNNGRWKIEAITALQVMVKDPYVTEEQIADGVVPRAVAVSASGAARAMNLVGKKLKVGKILRTYTMERRFTGINRFQRFRGCAFNSMGLNISPGAIVGGSFDVLGMTGGEPFNTTLGEPTPPSAHEPFDSFTGIMHEAGDEVGVVTGLNFSMTNGRSSGPVFGKRTTPDIFEGTFGLTGTFSVYMEDGSYLEKFLNEETVTLDVRLDDIGGEEFHRIKMGRVKYMGAPIDPPQQGPITIALPFRALVDPLTGSTVVWQRSNA